ncbi:sarcosine oxidase subunit gamma [Tateyamaria pelophila]|uniref:sarcosine oxidase subunit gamma n=1 Tax=Tateyamaria pelophila TaxID=328415 RepID=UPI001CBB26B9|nr:sarcosine oxidase subunit gamma family protein [Tateyamaria pelophila]
MGELIARTPLDGFEPLTIGDVTLSEVDMGVLTSVAPYKGQTKAIAAALQDAHGMAWPAPGRATGKAEARAIWFGRDMALLAGPVPDPSLAQHAALTDQSDAWTCLHLSGAGAEAILARLVPVDLRGSVFKRGHTVRSLVQHMNGSITRTGPQTFLIMVFRSMARTLVHDVQRAMESVASRG